MCRLGLLNVLADRTQAKNYWERKVARHDSSYRACPQAKLLYVA